MKWLELLLIVASFIFFFSLFYVIYKKVRLIKRLNNNKKKSIVVFVFAMILSILCLECLDKLTLNYIYYDICKGMFLGMTTALTPPYIYSEKFNS
jgi:uncharacterized protein YebE (UPF0316 family)